jgi:lipopolysaccharide/colanic/teichoic acid biosynthesis glycosyltransferase
MLIDEKIVSLNKYWKYLYPIHWFQRSRELNAIYSAREFHERINNECALADRYNQRFSLALFEMGNQNENSVAVRRLVRTLYSRFRNIDELGWYSNRQIGVILPYTPAEGAWTLAENVCALISSILEPPPFTIYTYPSEKWPKKSKKKIRGFLTLFDWLHQLQKIRPISSDNKFREILTLERERSNRTNNIFSLIVFDIGLFGAKSVITRRLIRILYRRIRITDKLGWYDNQHIGIILPCTSFENAHKMAKSFCREADITQFNCYTVITYPSNRDLSNKDDSIKQSISNISAERDSSVLRDISSSSTANVDGNTTSAAEPVEKQTQTYEKTNREFLPFLCRPIPVWKRSMDIVGAIVGLVVFSPIMLAIAIVIKLTSKGPIIFIQERAGLGGKPFNFYKFRSMVIDADARKKDLIEFNERTGPVFKMTDDPRVTPVGKFIRKWSLDELPQFYNVLKGDMSLVGPRPPTLDEVAQYYNWQDMRLEINPGITCLWQIYGRHKSSFDDWVRLDIEYSRRQSLLLDLKILLLTLPAVLSRRGAR